MAESKKITAVNIKKLWYGETNAITASLRLLLNLMMIQRTEK